MGKRRNVGRVTGVVVAALAACAVTTAAYAVYAKGPTSPMGEINGRNYENWALLFYQDGPHARGGALVQTTGSAIAPAGHLGAQGSLWTAGGALCTDTTWAYNSSAMGSMYNWTWATGCGDGYYYGDGQVRVWRPGAGTWRTAYPIQTASYHHY